MRGLTIIIVVFLSLSPAFTFEAEASFPSARIMPLGDSITVGYPGPAYDGYRKDLYSNLTNFGFNVNFVGSQNNGTDPASNPNEGHNSYTAAMISSNVSKWLTDYPADVLLLHIGTNDIQNGLLATAIVDEVKGILDKIDAWGASNGRSVTVILAGIILRSDNSVWNQTTMDYNNKLESLASTRSNVVMVDMEHALIYPVDLNGDGIHPTALGYGKMAKVWYDALVDVLGYSLTVDSVGNGEVTVNPDQSVYAYDTAVNLTAVADEGWTFSGWSGDLNSSLNPGQIIIDDNKTVTATFTRIQYTLTISSNIGTTTPAIGVHSYTAGTTVTVEAHNPAPITGVQNTFLGWTGTGSVPASGTVSTVTFTINANSTVQWNWKTQYYLTVSSPYGNKGNEGWYDAGSSAYAIITPTSVSAGNGANYVFSGWSGDASGSTSTSNAIVMNGPKTALANWRFEPASTPQPTATPKPTSTPTPTPTVTPTASTSPSPTVEPTVYPTQNPPDANSLNLYLFLGVFGLVSVGAIAGFVVFKRMKK